MDKFTEIKEEILRRAKNAEACVEQYKRALESETLQELAHVIKDNFIWCCTNKVLDVGIIEKYKTEFASVGIYSNESRSDGYVVVNAEIDHLNGNAIAVLSDNATIKYVYDNATIKYVYGNATIKYVYGNATINEVYGNATIKYVYGNAYISVYNYIECKINDYAIMRVRSEDKIYTNTPVEKPKL